MKSSFIALMLSVASVTQAQNLEQARQALLNALGNRMQLLDDSFAQREGDHGASRFWILRLRADVAGTYKISHHYSNRTGPYSPRTAEYAFCIESSGFRSLVGPEQSYPPNLRLGDIVVLVLNISPKYKAHMFTLEYTELDSRTNHRRVLPSRDADASIQVQSPVHEHLQCVAAKHIGPTLSRNMGGPPSKWISVTCVAKKPAEFNLDFTVEVDGVEIKRQGGSIPIQIVPAEQAIDHLIWKSWVREYDRNRGWSAGWWPIGQDTVVLREGDIFEVHLPPCASDGCDDKVRVDVHERPFKLEVGSIQDQLALGDSHPPAVNRSLSRQ